MRRLAPALLGLAALAGACAEADSDDLGDEIRFVSGALPSAEVGIPYAATIEAVAPPEARLTWTLVRGDLPEGLSVAYTGARARLEGVPRRAGTFDLTFLVFDDGGLGSAEDTFTLTVDAGVRLAVLGDPLPAAEIDAPFSARIRAQGGTEGYAWRISDGALPDGVSLTPAGTPSATLAGTPTEAGRFAFTVEVEDATGARATRGFALDVSPGEGPLRIVSALRTGGVLGAPYEVEFTAVGGEGAVAWRADGRIPGVRFTSGPPLPEGQARLTGTATAAGLFRVDVVATDSATTAALTWTQRVVARLAIVPDDLPAATIDAPFEATLRATPGAGGHQWSVAQGSLPPGLQLRPTGAVLGFGGAATALGEFPVVLEVRDASAQTATRAVTLEVVPPLEIDTVALETGVLGQPYVSPLEASGGRPPFEWFLVPTSAPAGVALASRPGRRVEIAGTAGEVGRFAVAVRVEDVDGRVAGRVLALDIVDSNAPLRLEALAVPPLTACEGFSLTVTATGGSNFGYRWRLTGDVPLGVSIDPIGTPTTALAGLVEPGRHDLRVEVQDSNGTIVGQDLTLAAPPAPNPPRLAVLDAGGAAAGFLATVDTCRRAPAVVQTLPGRDQLANTNVSLSRGAATRYLAWRTSLNGRPAILATDGDPSRFVFSEVQETDTGLDLDLLISDVAPDGTARLVYPGVRRDASGAVVGSVHRVVTLTSTSISAPRDVYAPGPPRGLVALHPLGLVVGSSTLSIAHRFADPTAPGIRWGVDAVEVFAPTPSGRVYGLFPSGLRRVSLATGQVDAPLPAVDARMGPTQASLLVRATAAGPWAVVDPEAASLAPQALSGSAVCGGGSGWAWSEDGSTVACASTLAPADVLVWRLPPSSAPPRVVAAPGPVRQLWLNPTGTAVLFTADDAALGQGAQVYAQDSRHGPVVDRLTTGARSATRRFEVWFARDRAAISADGLWVHDLGARAALFASPQARLAPFVSPWRADGTGLFVFTTAFEWLDLLPPSTPRIRNIPGSAALIGLRAVAN